MLPFDDKIVDVIDDAFKHGFSVPKYAFESNLEELLEISGDSDEVFFNHPMYFLKPDSIEFSYIIFWDGKKFHGGYISINNNYAGVQRGGLERNGETLFAGHVKRIRTCYKKVAKDKPMWLCSAFLLDNERRILYWGHDEVSHYEEAIMKLTGHSLDELEEKFKSGEKTYKPNGFVPSILLYRGGFEKLYIKTGEAGTSISSVWRNFYKDLSSTPRDILYMQGMTDYMRKAYAMLTDIIS